MTPLAYTISKWFIPILLGLFQKLSWGAHFFFRPLHPPGHTWSQSPPPQPSGHPHPTMDQICLDPQDKLTPSTPQTHCQQNTLPPQDKNVPVGPPRIISGTALSYTESARDCVVFLYLYNSTSGISSGQRVCPSHSTSDKQWMCDPLAKVGTSTGQSGLAAAIPPLPDLFLSCFQGTHCHWRFLWLKRTDLKTTKLSCATSFSKSLVMLHSKRRSWALVHLK